MPIPAAVAAVAGTAGRAAGGAATRALSSARGARGLGGRLLSRAWELDSAWNLASRAYSDKLPEFMHACTVIVQGGPLADIRRVWYMACAAAFGKMKRSVALRGGSAAMQATWDISGKACQIELVYQTSALSNSLRQTGGILNPTATVGGTAPIFAPGAVGKGISPKVDALGLIQIGPDQITLGTGWPDFLLKIGQTNALKPGSGNDPVEGSTYKIQSEPILPNGVRTALTEPTDADPRNVLREWPKGNLDGETYVYTSVPHRYVRITGGPLNETTTGISRTAAPTLPDDGRIITTGEKTHPGVQPVRPIIDGSTRTSLVHLVAAGLTEPCFLPEAPPVTNAPLYSRGLFVLDSGTGATADQVATTVNATRPDFTVQPGRDEQPAFISSDERPDNRGQIFLTPDHRGEKP